MEKWPAMLTWTGPMLLFLPPGMPSSLIAGKEQPDLGEDHCSILQKLTRSTILKKKSLQLIRLILFIKAVYTQTSSALQGTGELEQCTP